ncbi:MAG TPA: AzlC family ABC transporter permease [Kineosporiaceae bacterium]|nr:AzlC family ABC transporter permease [Kineosporiaceae bacterium]
MGAPDEIADARGGRARDADRAAVLRQALSIGVATGAYGVSFGALAVAAGLSVAQACVLSLVMFTGGSQLAFVGVVGAGGSAAAAVATAALLGARNGFYGLQMARLLRPRGWRRPLAAQVTIDESTAVGTAQAALRPDRPELARFGFWATAGAVFALWNASTLAGAVVGDALGDLRRYGLDAAAAAAFLALLWPRLRSRRTRLVAAAAAVVAAALVPVLPPGAPVLAVAVVAIVAGWRGPGDAGRSGAGGDPG